MARRTVITFAATASELFLYLLVFLPAGQRGLEGLITLIALIFCLAISVPLWISALLRAARASQWLWFVALLVLAPLAPFTTLIYGIVGPYPSERLMLRR